MLISRNNEDKVTKENTDRLYMRHPVSRYGIFCTEHPIYHFARAVSKPIDFLNLYSGIIVHKLSFQYLSY